MVHQLGARRSGPVALFVVVAVAAVAAGCGSSNEGSSNAATDASTKTIDLALDWNTYVPYHAPLYEAQDKGYFKKQGLDVRFHFTGGSQDAAVAVGTGKDQIAWADLSTAASNMLAGVPIVGVAQVQQKGATALVVPDDSPISQPADLRGKTLGSTPTGSDATVLPAFLKRNGLSKSDVTVANLPANGKLAALLSHKVDAINGQGYYYVAALDKQGMKARQLLYADNGLNLLDHGIIANRSFAKDHGATVTAFLRAYHQGLEYTRQHPDQACDLMVEKAGSTAMPKPLCLAQLKGFLALLPPASSTEKWGTNDPELWKQTVAVLKRYGGVKGDHPTSDMYTDSLLP